MKESAKWRSGRAAERTGVIFSSGRGGKRPPQGSRDIRIGRQHGGHMMVPPWIGSSFEVIETEFTLHILVGAFGPPPLLGPADQLVQARALGQRRERAKLHRHLVPVRADRDAALACVTEAFQ